MDFIISPIISNSKESVPNRSKAQYHRPRILPIYLSNLQIWNQAASTREGS